MTEPLKCDKCGNTSLTLLSSNIQGIDKVIDIYFCRKCQTSKTFITFRNTEPVLDAPINIDSFGDGDRDDYEEILEEPENPYEDEHDGWDPNIG
jgi:hypothetical protein